MEALKSITADSFIPVYRGETERIAKWCYEKYSK